MRNWKKWKKYDEYYKFIKNWIIGYDFILFILINKDIISEIYQNEKIKLLFENIYEIKFDHKNLNINDFKFILELDMKLKMKNI